MTQEEAYEEALRRIHEAERTLCRRLRDLPFDPTVPTTHGVQLGQTTVEMDGFRNPCA